MRLCTRRLAWVVVAAILLGFGMLSLFVAPSKFLTVTITAGEEDAQTPLCASGRLVTVDGGAGTKAQLEAAIKSTELLIQEALEEQTQLQIAMRETVAVIEKLKKDQARAQASAVPASSGVTTTAVATDPTQQGYPSPNGSIPDSPMPRTTICPKNNSSQIPTAMFSAEALGPWTAPRIWRCPRDGFSGEEDNFVTWLADTKALVPAQADSKPKGPGTKWAMVDLYEGRLIPAYEPPLFPVVDENIKGIRRDSECWRDPEPSLPPGQTKSATVYFCAVVKNRVKITLEWIMWHHILGGSKFILMDDGSEDGLEAWLRPLVQAGIVLIEKLKPDPWGRKRAADHGEFLSRPVTAWGRQLTARTRCVEVARKESTAEDPIWVAMLDPDEFFHSPICINHMIPSLIRKINDKDQDKTSRVGGFAFGMRLIGHKGAHVDRERTVLEGTDHAAGLADSHFKSIVRSDLVVPFDTLKPNLHAFQLASGFTTYFAETLTPALSITATGSLELLPAPSFAWSVNSVYIAHYYSRSVANVLRRAMDRPRYPADSRSLPELFGHEWSRDLQVGFHLKMSPGVQRWENWLVKALGVGAAQPYQANINRGYDANNDAQRKELLWFAWKEFEEGHSFGDTLIERVLLTAGINPAESTKQEFTKSLQQAVTQCSQEPLAGLG